jgi:hypothetical protein
LKRESGKMAKTVDMDRTESRETWKTNTLIIGAVLGALAGLGGAYLLIQNAERQGNVVSINAGDGVKLGLLLMGTLRQVAALGQGK